MQNSWDIPRSATANGVWWLGHTHASQALLESICIYMKMAWLVGCVNLFVCKPGLGTCLEERFSLSSALPGYDSL
jgi:hypothetical protein